MGFDMFSLKGKSAIVTGGSRGIGASICSGLADAGADVAVVSRKLDKCEEVASALREKGGNAVAIGAHVGRADDCDRVVDETVKAFGKVDILINNAAANPTFGPAIFCSDEAFTKIFDVNVKGPFMLTKKVQPCMEQAGGGAIVNIGSVAGIVPPPMIGMYGVSKAALMHMTRVFAKELGAYGIRVNAVAPGLVKTDFSKALWSEEDVIKDFLCKQPIQRLALPEDIVGAVLFLASPAASMITGTVITVDGGQLTG